MGMKGPILGNVVVSVGVGGIVVEPDAPGAMVSLVMPVAAPPSLDPRACSAAGCGSAEAAGLCYLVSSSWDKYDLNRNGYVLAASHFSLTRSRSNDTAVVDKLLLLGKQYAVFYGRKSTNPFGLEQIRNASVNY